LGQVLHFTRFCCNVRSSETGIREMSDTLTLLSKLRGALSPGGSGDPWELVKRIESSLDADPRYSKAERELVARLRSGVSDVLLAHREGLNPHNGLASVAITALESSLKKRTTGTDGWPLA